MDLSLLKEKIHTITHRIASRLDAMKPEKRRIFFISLVALFTLLLVIILLAVNTSSGQDSGRGGINSAQGLVNLSIPHDELFFPDEPDFVPEYLLEREPRLIWTIDDIRPYWRIPENNDFWLNEIRSAVDLLMEGIP